MTSQMRRLLPVSFLLVGTMIGCKDEPQPVVQERKTAAEKPKSAAVEPKVVEKPKATPRETKTAANGPGGKMDTVEKPKPVLDEAVVAQKEFSQTSRLPLRIANGIGMRLVLIPVGEFMMGSPQSGGSVPPWERPQHKVQISKPFYLGACEVTQVEYEKVMGRNPSYFKGPGNPVEQASWSDAVAFCKRLSAEEGKTYRLPTEAEWEYACRAGTTTRYSFGDDMASLEQYGWYRSNKTYPVGMRRPNAWGLYDMHGNVGEWCVDRWDENFYAISPADDPRGPETGSLRVIRGGSWKDEVGGCRAASRSGFVPVGRLQHVGFRVAADPSEEDVLPSPKADRVRQPRISETRHRTQGPGDQ